MLYLILAVLCSVAVSVLLKVARKHDIRIEQSILTNYLVATGMTYVFLSPTIKSVSEYSATAPIFIALGVLLPLVFIIMSRAVETSGIVKSDAAQRLSLFIPIVWALLFFGEVLTPARGLGIVLAFLALSALLYKPMLGAHGADTQYIRPQNNLSHESNTSNSGSTSVKTIAINLLGVWLGYGVIDVMFKQLSKLDKTAFAGNLFIVFVLSGLLLLSYLLYKKTAWHRKSLVSGLLLGVLNFCNILFYVRAHQSLKDDPTLVFAGMNIGVITLGTLVGAWLFKEKISRINALGIALAITAIFCLFYLAKLMPQWA